MRTVFEQYLAMPLPVLWLMFLALIVWRRRRTSRALFAIATVLFALASMPAVGKLLMLGLVSATPPLHVGDDRDYAAIVVPTGGSYDDGTGRWWPTGSSIARTVAGLALHRRLGLPLILSGGAPLPGQPAEAVTVAAEFGLTDPAIRLETRSRNSSESAAAVAAILAGEPVRRVLLVTDTTHMARMSAVLRRNGLSVATAPVGTQPRDLAPGAWGIIDFVPGDRGLKLTRGALREYAAIAWYIASGRLDIGDVWPPGR